MRIYEFEVPGIPMAWKRARATVRYGHASRFEDKLQTSYKADIRSYLKKQCGQVVASPCPFTLYLRFEFPLLKGDYNSKGEPNKHGKAKLSEAELRTKKPDIDNLTKMVMDALNGVVWLDDSQVVQLVAEKAYSEESKTLISVYGAEIATENLHRSVERIPMDKLPAGAEKPPREAENGGNGGSDD